MYLEKKKEEVSLFKKQGKEAIKELCSKKWYRQIPNLLTASRFIAPLVVFPLALTGNMIGAVIAEIIFASTDFLDGLIARTFHFYSDFGKKLDTICDKMFAITLLLPIILINPIVIANIGLEVLIGYINTVSLLKGNKASSSKLGKIKTGVLSISIILTYLSIFLNIPTTVLAIALGATTASQAIAAYDYYQKDKIQTMEKKNKKGEIVLTETKEEIEKEVEPTIHYENNFPKEYENTIEKRKSFHK